MGKFCLEGVCYASVCFGHDFKFYGFAGFGGRAFGSEHSLKKDRFAAADSNGDNKVSRAEFMAMANKRFTKMDKNGDGVLTKDEMRRRKHKGHSEH